MDKAFGIFFRNPWSCDAFADGELCRFNVYHKEKLPSAIERYANEIKRVTSVLNNALEGKEYLVGDKCTYADLSFIPWATIAPFAMGEHKIDLGKEYPNYHAWMERLMARPAVKKVLAEKQKVTSG